MKGVSIRAAPAPAPTRTPGQDTLWEAGWGRGQVPHTRRERVAAAAVALVGIRFRPHGRDPRFDYSLRHGDAARARAAIDELDLIAGVGGPGEVLLCASAPGQLHLAISIAGGLVHADALLRRVVARPGAAPWPLLGRWRLEEE